MIGTVELAHDPGWVLPPSPDVLASSPPPSPPPEFELEHAATMATAQVAPAARATTSIRLERFMIARTFRRRNSTDFTHRNTRDQTRILVGKLLVQVSTKFRRLAAWSPPRRRKGRRLGYAARRCAL